MKILTYRFPCGPFAGHMEIDQRLAGLAGHRERNPEGYTFHRMVQEGVLSDSNVKAAIETIHDALQKLEARLADHDWLVGDQISLADYCWGPNVYCCMEEYMLGFPMGRYPAVRAWYKRLFQDEAFQKGVVSYSSVPLKPVLAIKN
ncbi:uncharacterized protein LOC110991009, partial [Acanthaster planci]|uniref:Uncharacterized protein LOC110991009 n=1 Tax=Acanthaster planci TaxID=133434 RepID=A0A8B8A4B4_ACAPL